MRRNRVETRSRLTRWTRSSACLAARQRSSARTFPTSATGQTTQTTLPSQRRSTRGTGWRTTLQTSAPTTPLPRRAQQLVISCRKCFFSALRSESQPRKPYSTSSSSRTLCRDSTLSWRASSSATPTFRSASNSWSLQEPGKAARGLPRGLPPTTADLSRRLLTWRAPPAGAIRSREKTSTAQRGSVSLYALEYPQGTSHTLPCGKGQLPHESKVGSGVMWALPAGLRKGVGQLQS
mmetsp:Transcript_11700/g.33110  ORF Transcript_11700/g.33110 Transcript_11700/m.33110 type:complete len:236 (-) Transcript_11700:181-888(-)